jgi:hypothetical protein
MPPQQADRLLDLFDCLLDFRSHSAASGNFQMKSGRDHKPMSGKVDSTFPPDIEASPLIQPERDPVGARCQVSEKDQ